MAGSTSGNGLRTLLGNEINVLFNINYTTSETDYSGTGTIAAPLTEPGYLYIDLAAGAAPGNLFVPSGYGIIQNVNDTSPIIGPSTTDVTTTVGYIGDSGSQTFYSGTAGAGAEYISMTGFGNLVTIPATGSGNYLIATGLVSAENLVLAPATPGLNADGSEQGNTIVGGSGFESISAGLGANEIFLGSGFTFVASEGTDTIIASAGASTIVAGGDGSFAQSSLVFQGAGKLTLFGSKITGTSDSATVVGGSGALQVTGGVGALTVYGSSGANVISGGSNGGNLLVAGSGGNSLLYGGGANDTLVGAGATDTIVAGTGNETLFGGSGADTMFSGVGNDMVVLGGGSDLVFFGSGTDSVFAGTGTDIFGYQQGLTTAATDIISGFNTAVDQFLLYSTDSASSIVGSAVVSGGNTTFTFDNHTSVELLGVTNLTTANFVGGGLV